MKVTLFSLFLAFTFLAGCTTNDEQPEPAPKNLFVLLSPKQTNIGFANTLSEGAGVNRNILMYEYFYNGSGVAVGDLNGDNLDDIYFTANMGYNKLFLNQGNMEFKEITDMAGVRGRQNTWNTGVTMADVNGDGFLDIYVCYSGQLPLERRIDELYINQGANENGIPQFEEKGESYGLAYPHSSNKGTFFDYDRDGDLDLFLLTHNPESLPVLNKKETKKLLAQNDSVNGIRLYRNDSNEFVDVTRDAGIQSSPLTYGLGVGITDINKDGWPDIYIANDFSPPDYLYINNKDGTFTDKIDSYFGHTSYASMGIDIADINNDALSDIYVLDMLPEGNKRQKLLAIPNDRDQFEKNVDMGFHHQYMRNMLHLNNGNDSFSEIGQLAGISNTGWSWAPLFADYNNNGWKDLFVTNGIVKDLTNRDFIEYESQYIQRKNSKLQPSDVTHLLDKLPSAKQTNYIFQNNGDLRFSDMTTDWGIDFPSNSTGAAYSDLDNDGDIDLITNNINDSAHILENKSQNIFPNHHYLKIRLKGSRDNTYGIGTKITAYIDNQKQYLEQMPMRGYLSSVSPTLHFGLGEKEIVDSLYVVWPNGEEQTISNIKTDQEVTIRQKRASKEKKGSNSVLPLFNKKEPPITFNHQVGNINDFRRQPLMPNSKSFIGPGMAKADINNDALMDIFIGGGAGQDSKIYIQKPNGEFQITNQPAIEADKSSNDVDALFFDANGNGHKDLYIASGGYGNFGPIDPELQDRLYLNNGSGNFAKSNRALPEMATSTSIITKTDINEDGIPDLFVGGYIIPGRYPEIPRSYILINDGQGSFNDKTSEINPNFKNIGMVSDATWHDLNGNGAKELVLAGQWMPLSIFSTENGKLVNKTDKYFDKPYEGLWNKILVDDFNKDGNPDIIAGNFGLNSQLQASENEQAELIYRDFDDNGSIDPILNFNINGRSYPFVTFDELIEQIPSVESRFSSYESYSEATMEDIFTENELGNAKKLNVNHLNTTLFINEDGERFKKEKLPIESQFSPIFSITTLDYNSDGNHDLLLGGNMNHARIRFGQYDASYGILLRNDGEGNFSYIPQSESGFKLRGDVRKTMKLDNTIIFGISDKSLKYYKQITDTLIN